MTRIGRLLVVMALLTGACGGGASERTIVVSAASSLTDAFSDLEQAFEAATPGVDVVLDLGSSSLLATRIIGGAPADVFASADLPSMERVIDASADAIDTVPFATNRLSIAVEAGNPRGVTALTDLAREDLVVGLCITGVPCGDLARAVLAIAGVEPALDTEEPNVRALATKIAAGEVDVGLVYVTDVTAIDGLDGVATGVDLSTEYWIAPLGDPMPEAQAFVDFVRSPEGRTILARYGFGSP